MMRKIISLGLIFFLSFYSIISPIQSVVLAKDWTIAIQSISEETIETITETTEDQSSIDDSNVDMDNEILDETIDSTTSEKETESDKEAESELVDSPTIEEPTNSSTSGTTITTPNEGTIPGKLIVELNATSSLSSDLAINLQLSKENGQVNQQKTTLNKIVDAQASQSVVEFKQLEPGTYTATITANGYQTYTQTITIDKEEKKISIYTDFLDGYEYSVNKAHPGVLQKIHTYQSDFNNDQVINELDKNLLIDAISDNLVDTTYDINGDGSVNLLDLQIFSVQWEQWELDQINAQKDTLSSIESKLNLEALEITSELQSKVNGEISDLTKDEGSVTVSPSNEEAISETNPVELSFALPNEESVQMEMLVLNTNLNNNAIEEGFVSIVLEDGTTKEYQLTSNAAARSATITRDENGNFTLDLGKQVAVKKVTIKVTKTSGSTNLAEISKVEFLNDTQNRIPEPDMSIPEAIEITNASNSFIVTWKHVTNVAGYEVIIKADSKEEIIKTDSNFLLVEMFSGKKLENYKEYSVQIRSINGNWKSPLSNTYKAVPKPEKKPDAPDNVTVTGDFKSLKVSWKNMKDTLSYSVYYKEKDAKEFTLYASNITQNSIQITDLKDLVTYQVYVIGHNELGDSPASLIAEGTTQSVLPAIMPNYKVINQSNGELELSDHIVSVTLGRGFMVNSPLDANDSKSALGLVDNSYDSYLQVNDWDEGGAYPGPSKGVIVKFDQKYQMNRIMLAEASDIGSYYYSNVKYIDENGKEQTVGTTINRKMDSNKRYYYDIKFDRPVTTDQLRIGIGRYGSSPGKVVIAEMKFYHYDSLEDEINALFTDALHLELDQSVNKDTIQQLQERLDTKDEVSGEYVIDREELQKELDMALAILNDEQKGSVLAIDPTITAKKDGHLGFTGLNAWQPIGVSALAGDKITIYVGSPNGKIGDKTSLTLVPTQYYAESSSLTKQTFELKIGKNEITIPQISSLADEKGGALYIAYNGNNANDQYSVRISGGTTIPVLNLHGITDSAKRLELTKIYVEQLIEAVTKLEKAHQASHKEYEYNLKTCVTNATDIQLQQMMLSLPATQVLEGIKGGSVEEQATRLLQSLDAMDQMMTLFYQHKGLSNDEKAGATNRLPSQHLNIRYMRMFAGAFMYAAGNHIGIEWNETVGLTKGVPLVTDNGKYVSGELFGWGIGHEIGHDINQGNYAIAEITNNYFAQLSTARDTNDSVRFDYDVIFDKTTSNAIGQSSDVFTQLAMYWQLKLAYDKNYSFKLFDNYDEQFNELFFARVDTYSRNPGSAPKPNNIALTLNAGPEQNFIRLASAAAQRDLTAFFTRWGLIPTAETLEYISQFEPETRAIYYGDDNAHTYLIQNGFQIDNKAWSIDANSSSVIVDEKHSNRVHLSIKDNLTNEQKANLQGYEITRIMTENGVQKKEVVGFTRECEYTDIVSTINNRVIGYEVRMVDKSMNYTDAVFIGSVKISSDGSHDKSDWKVTTNMESDDDEHKHVCEDNPDDAGIISAIDRVIDNKENTIYTGISKSKDAEIIFDLRRTLEVTALKFTGTEQTDVSAFEIQVSEDGTAWKTVKEGSFKTKSTTPQTVYFANESSDKFVGTYDARYVKLVFKNSKNKEVNINEIDILGPSGDNVEWITTDGQVSIGILDSAYVYDEKAGYSIPAGSLIFAGKYKGHPAFNVVLLYDEKGQLVGSVDEEGTLLAEQIILAEIPEKGDLGETSDGTFIYWLNPGTWTQEQLPSKVRAELYRVDNAQTNEGQRLVSDTTFIHIPQDIPKIEIK